MKVVTDEDLEAYAKRKEVDEKKAAAAASAAGGGGGMGGFAGGAADVKKPPAVAGAVPAGSRATVGVPGRDDVALGLTVHPITPGAVSGVATSAEDVLGKIMLAAGPQSELERHLQQYNRCRLEFTGSRLRAEVEEMVDAFDSALGSLRREKFKLEADLKLSEIKQLVCYQELGLLRDFDKRENVLLQKRQTKLDERQEILDRIGECDDCLVWGLQLKFALFIPDHVLRCPGMRKE